MCWFPPFLKVHHREGLSSQPAYHSTKISSNACKACANQRFGMILKTFHFTTMLLNETVYHPSPQHKTLLLCSRLAFSEWDIIVSHSNMNEHSSVSYLLQLHFLVTVKMVWTKRCASPRECVDEQGSSGEWLWMPAGQRTSSEVGSSAVGADYIDYMHHVRKQN